MVSALVLSLLLSGWPGDEMPLPVTVKGPEDLQFKAAAERQYLIFNLMVSGRLAYERGEWPVAAEKWEALLKVPDLPASVDAAVRPLAVIARQKAGGTSSLPPAPPAEVEKPAVAAGRTTPPPAKHAGALTITGTVQGGGSAGPGGAVVYLKRLDQPTPRPKPGKQRTIVQKDKRFEPRVLAVTVGTSVEFRNDDPLFHNVFSLSRPNDFDLGLYKGGTSKSEEFDTPGAVQLLCNIHSSMLAWVYVVDTPWFAQADGAGRFTIKGVPPGEYQVQVWHEAASKVSEQKLRLAEGAAPLELTVDGDKGAPAFVPDKSGKPRQPQLGY
jgi:plastocyanin